MKYITARERIQQEHIDNLYERIATLEEQLKESEYARKVSDRAFCLLYRDYKNTVGLDMDTTKSYFAQAREQITEEDL